MQKKMRSSVILDRLHRGAVYTCLGLTAYGGYLLGWRVYRYFTVIKPARDQQQIMSKEHLLSEGSSEKLLVDPAHTIRT